MSRNFNWKGLTVKDPRIAMRMVIGALLIANLVAAIMAFKPFGGSADDLRRDQAALRAQLAHAQANLDNSRRLVDKVQTARSQGDQFLTKYVVNGRSMSSTIQEELDKVAASAGIKAGQASFSPDAVEGSDTLYRLTISAGFEGTYPSLTKLVNLLDRSPRFLIVDSMTAVAPQGQGDKALNVTLKLITYFRDETGAVL